MAKLEDRIEIANPHQPHCATVLLLDTSGSMSEGGKINALTNGLTIFKEDVSKDDLASKRVDISVITFGGSVAVTHDFSSIEEFEPPVLSADGYTPMGDAILKAIELIEQRKQQYKNKGIDYYRPWIFMITDGEPTDMVPGDLKWNEVTRKVHDGENNKKFMFFAVAVETANTDLLRQIAPPNRPPIRLKEGKFKDLFTWLSKSQSKVSTSKMGEQVALENPVAAGWGEIST
ncbi:MAG: VWA domain-containing protein [Candidatus Kuenenia sp.]|nr:VWA domain-containing protein [Candidatus Kuenenia hertensis]